MKTFGGLYRDVCSFENLLLAFRKARRGKRFGESVGAFELNLEKELVALRGELLTHDYQPGAYHAFYVYEPKKRMISAAPFKDRVVHHALCNVIAPLFERAFIDDSYANRTGKGTHRAILRYQQFCWRSAFVLKCDIRRFFPSIDHEVLKAEVRRTIACADTLRLIDTIIDHSNPQEQVSDYFDGDTLFTPWERRRGLPIGNLTSQFFANVYLNRFDHYVKEHLHCREYIRYVDDFVLFSPSLATLAEWKGRAQEYLSSVRLTMHETKSRTYRVTDGVRFLGQRIYPTHRLLDKANVLRMRRRLALLQQTYASGSVSLEAVRQSIRSWIGHAQWADTYKLREALFADVVFLRG